MPVTDAGNVGKATGKAAGVAYHRRRALSALLVVTDAVSSAHTWGGTATLRFRRGVERATRIAARVFSKANP